MDDYYQDIPPPPIPMPGPKSDEAYTQMLMQKKIENLLTQLDPDHLIVEVEYRLKGYRKNEFSGDWELIGKQPRSVSDELLVDVMSLLSSMLTNNTTMSNFQDLEINRIMKSLIRKLIDMIRSKARLYNIDKIQTLKIKERIPTSEQEVMDSMGQVQVLKSYKYVEKEVIINTEIDFAERDRVLWIICYSVFAAMKRAQNGLEAKRILESFDIKENYQPQKRNIAEGLQFWR